MRILVKRGSSLINDLRFDRGPIYIGRQRGSQVFLPDRAVSRQHAVILMDDKNNWHVQDLQSANRTIVNGQPATQAPLHEGDVITVADFSIEIHFDHETSSHSGEVQIDLNDTIVHEPTASPAIYKTSREKPLHLVADRIENIYNLTADLCFITDQDILLTKLVNLLLEQFDAYHVWAGLRETTSGPITCHGGCTRAGHQITLEQLLGKKIIKNALQSDSCVLLPNIADVTSPADTNIDTLVFLRSAMAVSIASSTGAYGVIYVDNGADKTSYTHHDLDYLTLVGTLIAAFIEHIG